jgi:hypothetical protein
VSGTLILERGVDIEDVDDMDGRFIMFCLGRVNALSDLNLTFSNMDIHRFLMTRNIESPGGNSLWSSSRDLVTKWTISYCDVEYVVMLSNEEFRELMEDAENEWIKFKAQAVGVELPLMGGWL